ncbi:tryptophan 2,3-dioxygenase family protein [Saccharomonospora piscinae]|uniref:tryptophan 2,3-dioxygenase family protein n=1 Tax=Saccharomonospora piscinae TaxID=687388 RepID=UPI0004647264|nr:tryptophan 2,3-dioxygenase family protein [Saccharomonospora piscinae]
MTGVTYSGYLRLGELLATVRPMTRAGDRRVYAAEHFFIVAHQATELWLKQVLLDLDCALGAASAPDRDLEQAALGIQRAAAVMRLLTEHVGVLRGLAPRDFADFRGGFGQASGADSEQFARLRLLLGAEVSEEREGPESPLYTELAAAAAEWGTSLDTVYRRAPHSGALYRLAESLVELSQAYWAWQVTHVEVVSGAIGRARGTGGTSGFDYLADRLTTPFPEIWRARRRLHEPTLVAELG